MTRTAISRRSLEAAYQRRDAELREMQNPDSRYWMNESKASQATLEAMIGAQAYEAWAELVWPGDVIDGKTWKDINRATTAAINEAMQGKRDIQVLADAARYPEQPKPQCYGL